MEGSLLEAVWGDRFVPPQPQRYMSGSNQNTFKEAPPRVLRRGNKGGAATGIDPPLGMTAPPSGPKYGRRDIEQRILSVSPVEYDNGSFVNTRRHRSAALFAKEQGQSIRATDGNMHGNMQGVYGEAGMFAAMQKQRESLAQPPAPMNQAHTHHHPMQSAADAVGNRDKEAKQAFMQNFEQQRVAANKEWRQETASMISQSQRESNGGVLRARQAAPAFEQTKAGPMNNTFLGNNLYSAEFNNGHGQTGAPLSVFKEMPNMEQLKKAAPEYHKYLEERPWEKVVQPLARPHNAYVNENKESVYRDRQFDIEEAQMRHFQANPWPEWGPFDRP